MNADANGGGSHPRLRLDDNFASPIRFSLMAVLADGSDLDFGTLADILDVGDSALSKAITHLQGAGYLTARKVLSGGRPRTWVTSRPGGREAFARHVEALRQIVELGSAVDAERSQAVAPTRSA